MDLDLLVFDMGHVFVDFEWATVCQAFCQRTGCTQAKLKATLPILSALGYESGRIGTAAFLAHLNQHLQCDLKHDEFVGIWTTSFRENLQMAELLQQLKDQRPLYLLSNTNEAHYNWLQANYDVARHFQELILSYQVGCTKPEPAIYQKVLQRSGLPADRCLFVDDLHPNIQAAANLGMHTVHFQGIDHLKMQLRSYGLQA